MAQPAVPHARPGLIPGLVLLALLFSTISPVHAGPVSSLARRAIAVVRPGVVARLNGIPTVVQTLNNCGPASISEVLHYWGIDRTQGQVQAVVRADNSPRGMAPFGVPAYMRSLRMRGMIGVAGTERLIQMLVSNGFPVIVSQWVSAADPIRHYRPIVGYDTRRGMFVSSDPYLGADHLISFSEFARIWTVSNGRFLVLSPQSRQARLDAVLAAAGWSRRTAFRQDLAWEQHRLTSSRDSRGPLAATYAYGSMAWDEMELGDVVAARRLLREAAARGASPVVVGWITAEMAWRSSGRK